MLFVLNEIGWVRLVKMYFWVFGGGVDVVFVNQLGRRDLVGWHE